MAAAGVPGAPAPGPAPVGTNGGGAGGAGGAPPVAETAAETADAVEPAAISDEAPPGELPSVDELVRQLRPELLATMEELFRAQWSGVKRLRPEDLKGP